ncbi:trimeric LpxA-like protein [Piromyces finnis]|uniref:Trimeric LpxA-like protein n=1 Tax=Piromyces finnis TaxID=1754191 RepID=A0A1Y1VC17_9FUNG|nr:trimeric LpxA-like protein [Piromyces finnis]|eukprot:ORX52201.1 trimeric LpxA-like protein [Piromyces finnis]
MASLLQLNCIVNNLRKTSIIPLNALNFVFQSNILRKYKSTKNIKEKQFDLNKITPKKYEERVKSAQLIHQFNHTMPYTEKYDKLMNKVFGGKIGKDSMVMTPVSGSDLDHVTIGDNVFINSGALFMATGGITIEDNSILAANVQIITNNHDIRHHNIIKCKPIHLKKNCWIGAGVTILPGVTIGENSVVGAGSIVTKDIEDNSVAVGSPAKVIKKIQ